MGGTEPMEATISRLRTWVEIKERENNLLERKLAKAIEQRDGIYMELAECDRDYSKESAQKAINYYNKELESLADTERSE